MNRFDLPDRRKIYRVYSKIPLVCETIDLSDNTVNKKNAVAIDLSQDGIYFETDEIMTLGSELKVSFRLPKSTHNIQTNIKIIRVETTGRENNYGIGATFIKLADKDREDIERFLENTNINKLLELAIKREASDLHLVTNLPVVLRIHGEIEILGTQKLDAEEIPKLVYTLMTKQQIKKFEQEKELDFGVQFDAQRRFRVNVHQQRGFIEAAFRLMTNQKISSFEELNIPQVVQDLARQRTGLVLISGSAGSGKTTTIAAMIEAINRERKAVIITLERPIEYVHANIKSIIKQREVGVDTNSFSAALKSTLKQDPNVIVVGELEDSETVRTALIAAEAGYLVIASLHAPNTVQAIDRLANIFPAENRKQVLCQISNCLKGIVCQVLMPCVDKQKSVLACEVVINNDAIKRVIRNDELFQIPTIIQTSSSLKMQSISDSINRYVMQGLVEQGIADLYSEEFLRFLK